MDRHTPLHPPHPGVSLLTPPLNEPFGNVERLASLEQRAAVALPHDVVDEVRKALRSSANCSRAYHVEQSSKVALANLEDAITAALSAQPRVTPEHWIEIGKAQALAEFTEQRAAQRRELLAAPQPREVRGVDAVRALVAEWRQRPGITDAYKICATELETALATTPQDAADVEGAAVYLMQSDFGLWKEQTKAEHEWWEGRQSAPLRRVLYTTPPPGVDVAALRQIAGELRDNAHHHQQEDRAVGIFADEQEAQFNTELAQRIERALAGDAAAPGTGKNS